MGSVFIGLMTPDGAISAIQVSKGWVVVQFMSYVRSED